MKTAILIVLTSALAVGQLYGQATEQPPPIPAEEQPEILTRGPVHEAFAEPVDLQNQEGLVAPTQPPANIVENPPADKPAGGQFVWVPGYWAWDSERNDYIWVSGCWRAAPPNMYWVPGYWAKVTQGWQWIAGFWAPVDGHQIEYLPAPPALDDLQPPDVSPYPDQIWVPPCWFWYQGRYISRHGYWLAAQADWVWVPSYYVWTPRGYVFAAGHWDYSLERRGLLFAPVYFPRHVYMRPGFSFSLSVVVDIGRLQFGLFTFPRYCHYYFGDYYDDFYIGIGIFPRFECRHRHTWYDPIYEHDRWSHRRTEPRWEENERHEYDIRRADKNLRPPRTYRQMEERQAGLPESKRRDIQIAEPFNKIIADKSSPMKFEPIKNDARQKLSRDSTDMDKFREERRRWESPQAGRKTVQTPVESKGPVTVTPPIGRREQAKPSIERKPGGVLRQETNQTEPERVNIPSSPVVGKRGILNIFDKGPPSRPADEKKADVKDTHGGGGRGERNRGK